MSRPDILYRRSAFTSVRRRIPPPSAHTLHRTLIGSSATRCRRLVLPTADLGSLWSQIQQAAASSSDVTSSSFSPRPWNSLRIKKLSWSLGTLHLFSTVQLLHSERNLKIQVKKRKAYATTCSLVTCFFCVLSPIASMNSRQFFSVHW